MNRLSTNTILALAMAFLALGTFALIGASIAEAIHPKEAAIFLTSLTIVHLLFGFGLLFSQHKVFKEFFDQNKDKE